MARRNARKQEWVFPLISPDSDDWLSLNLHRFVILYISCDTRSVGLGQYCLPKVCNGFQLKFSQVCYLHHCEQRGRTIQIIRVSGVPAAGRELVRLRSEDQKHTEALLSALFWRDSRVMYTMNPVVTKGKTQKRWTCFIQGISAVLQP